MAKVKFAPDVESISGKLCSRSGVIYAVNKQTGITHRTERHEFTDANTEAQQAVRKTFVTKGKFAAAWWKANKPSDKQRKLSARDEGLQGSAQDWQPLQLCLLPRYRRHESEVGRPRHYG